MAEPQDEDEEIAEDQRPDSAVEESDAESRIKSAVKEAEKLDFSSPEPEENFEHELDELYTSYYDSLLHSISMRPPSDSRFLSESVGEYIINKPSQDRSKKESTIEDSLSDLPLRISRLLYDIMLLWEGDYLNDIDTNWSYLSSTPEKLTDASKRFYYNDDKKINQQNFAFEFGYNIGLGFSALTGKVSEDDRSSSFLAGFSKAYSSGPLHRANQEIDHDINYFSTDDSNFFASEIVLDRYGILMTENINKRIVELAMIEEEVHDEKLTPEKATRKYINEKLNQEFGKCSILREKLEDEWEEIEDASVPGINIKDALESFWKLVFDNERATPNLTTADSGDVAKHCKSAKRYKNQVTQTFNRLSLDGKQPSEKSKTTFKYAEIVQHENRGWMLTGYGQLLLYCIFEKDNDFSWIQEAGINVSSRGWDELINSGGKQASDAFQSQSSGTISQTDYQLLKQGVDAFYDEQ